MSGDIEAKSSGYTHIRVQKFCYKWTINNFSFFMDEIRETITSPVFSLEASEDVAWCLRVHPNGLDEESQDYLSVCLVLLSSPENPVWAKFEFWIINSQGEKYITMTNSNVVSFWKNQQWGFKKFIFRDLLLSNLSLLLPEDQLTLGCKVSMVGGFVNIPGQNMTPAIKDPRLVLTDDLGELWEKSLFTDCSMLVGSHEFRAHKAILGARSPVFRAMFEHEMQERLKNCVEIHDMDLQVFKEMMDFIYRGKAPQMHSNADGVLAAADRYGMEGFMVMCEDVLCRKLSVENAADTLILADLHSRMQLKTQALDFIARHASEVSKTSGWKSMVKSHPYLVAEAFHSLASVQCPSLESKVISGAGHL